MSPSRADLESTLAEYFHNKLVETIQFMEILNLKDSVEKDIFFRKLPNLVEQLPRQIVLKKVPKYLHKEIYNNFSENNFQLTF